jgi:multiple sugar transport system permease protein
LYYPGLALIAALFLFPLLWMVSYSLRPTGLPPPVKPEVFAPPYAFDNYLQVDRYMAIMPLLWNSLRVVLVAVPLTLATASWAGLAIAQLPRRARVLLLTFCVALLLVPATATWVPRFILYTRLGWIDTFLPLIAPALMGTSPFYVILFYVSFARLPGEIYEAARLEGANPFQVWYLIALPMTRPAVIAVALLAFALYWSNYIDPQLYLNSEANYTFPLAVRLLEQAHRNNFPVLMAASVIMVAPVVVLFAFAQSFFLQGQIALAQLVGQTERTD